MFAKATAFVRRDLALAASYRLTFVQNLITLGLGLGGMSLIARFVNQGSPETLEAFGGDYLGFVLLGIATLLFLQTVVDLIVGIVRSAQGSGTMEVLLSSRTSLPAFLLYSSIYGLLLALIRAVFTVVLGAIAFGADLRPEGVLLATTALVLAGLGFAGIGVLSAGFLLSLKQREPFTPAFMTGSVMLSGIIYPVAALPEWLQTLAPLLPLTHVATLIRVALLEGAEPVAIAAPLLVLAAFSLLLPLGLLLFRLAVHRAQRDGTLGHY